MQDLNHVKVLAKQFCNTLKCDVAIVQEDNKYNFYALNYAEKRGYKILDIVRVPADEEILQDGDDRGIEVPAEDEGGEDTGDERIIIADVDNGITEFNVGVDDIGAFEFDEGQELLG